MHKRRIVKTSRKYKMINDWVIENRRVELIKELKPSFVQGRYGIILLYNAINKHNKPIVEKYKKDGESLKDLIDNCSFDFYLLSKMSSHEMLGKVDNLKFENYHVLMLKNLQWCVDTNITYKQYKIYTSLDQTFGDYNKDMNDFLTNVAKLYHMSSKRNYIGEGDMSYYKIYTEFIEMLPKIISNFPLEFRKFKRVGNFDDVTSLSDVQKKYISDGWTIDISEFRDQQIEKIVYNV